MRRIFALSASLFLASTALPTLAQNAALQTQTQNQAQTQAQRLAFTSPATVPQDLARIDKALNETLSFQGRFAQYGADGSFSQGQIFLNRPGKLRFEYDAPETLVIVSDGVTLTEHDKALNTMDRVPLSATPLNFFLKENVQLSRDTEITGLTKTPTDWAVTARDGSGEMDGEITMVFNANNLALREWIIRSSFGGGTRVVLSDLRYNQRINPRLFTLRDDRRRDRRR
jgi:outer membrane lipoprotein-sorting protein